MYYTPKFQEFLDKVRLSAEVSDQEAIKAFKEGLKELGWLERVRNLYRVRDKLSGDFVFFRPNQCQLRLLEERSGHDEILKARQLGMTTLMCVYAYDRALWDEWSCGIMSHIKERTEKIFEIIKDVNHNFKEDWGHFWLPEEESNSSHRMSWKESKGDVMVSFDFQSLTRKFLHVSEGAFIDERRITNSLQSVPENGEVCIESTANGRGGFFYDKWTQWKKSGALAPYKGHFFPWFDHYPEDEEKWEKLSETQKVNYSEREEELMKHYEVKPHQILWRRWKINADYNGDEEKFEVDYPADDVSCFLSGENRFFSAKVMKYQESFIKDPSFIGDMRVEERQVKFRESKGGLWRIWEAPKVNSTYVLGIDASEGIGRDRGIIFVLNRNTGEQVAGLAAQLHPDQLADQAWMAAQFYKQAWICPEANTVGHSLIQELVRRNYGKIYKRKSIDEFTQKLTSKLGFQTNVNTKVPLTDNFMIACRQGEVRVRDSELLNEMSTFVQIGSKSGRTLRREALPGCHDDYVIAACLAYEMHRSLGNSQDMSENWLREEESKLKFDEDTGFLIPSNDGDLNAY